MIVQIYNIAQKVLFNSVVVALGVLCNCVLYLIGMSLKLPIFLDSVFTITTAAAFGIVPGVLVGGLTNLVLELILGFPGYLLPFAPVNMCSALIVGAMVRAGFLSNIVGAFWVILALALGNSFLGAFIVTTFFGGITNQYMDDIVRSLMLTGRSVITAAFLGRIFINIVDKGIAILVALPIYYYVTKRRLDGRARP